MRNVSDEGGILIIGSGFAGVWAGAVATAGRDREVRLTGEAAKALKKAICESYIYPPVNDAGALMAEAGRRPHPAVLV